MGRILEALKRTDGPLRQASGHVSRGTQREAPADVVPPEPAEVPFIEVGGPDRTVEGSPSVLAVSSPKAAPPGGAASPGGPRATAAGAWAVTFQARPVVSAPLE